MLDALTPKKKWISTSDMCQGGPQLDGPPWSFRDVELYSEGDISWQSVPVQKVVETTEMIVDYVEKLCISYYDDRDADISEILSGLCSPRATHLKKLDISGSGTYYPNIYNIIFPALKWAPCLEELSLTCVRIYSPKSVEEFLATSNTLKKLVLFKINSVLGDDTTAKAVADAFHRGLQNNDSLTKITLVPDWLEAEDLVTLVPDDWLPAEELFSDDHNDYLLQQCLLGIIENRNQRLQEVSLRLDYCCPLSDETLSTVRALVSNTTCIQKFEITSMGAGEALVPFFLGLASNESIQEIDVKVGSFNTEGKSVLDERLAGAIQECCANNQTVQVLKVFDGWSPGPLSRESLANGLSQWGSLKDVNISGEAGYKKVVSYSRALEHIAKFQRVSLCWLESPEWGLVPRGMRNVPENSLRVLDLSGNALSTEDLQTVLPSFSRLSELSMNYCNISLESVPVICAFIECSALNKLCLASNPIGIRGANNVMDAVAASPSVEYLNMSGLGRASSGFVDINECRGSLRMLLSGSRLVSLDLGDEYNRLNRDAICSIAAGIRGNRTLKNLKLPPLNLAFIYILGEALTEDCCSIQRLIVPCWDANKELDAAEETSVLSFIGSMSRMKSLAQVDYLFDVKQNDRIDRALVSCLKENSTLMVINKRPLGHKSSEHDYEYPDEDVQFFLELNRMGRQHWTPSKPIPTGVLPYLFARMTHPACRRHLFYFLQHTPPDLHLGCVPQTKRFS